MPTKNARGHVIPAGTERSFKRSAIFEDFGNSIHDIIPVASITERSQLVAALTTAGVGPSAANPLVVHRSDAPGMHRIESTVNGTIWVPADGVMSFASKADADSFGTANPGLLLSGDQCRVGAALYRWDGAVWVPRDTGWINMVLFTGWSAVSGHTPRVRMKDDVIYTEGAVQRGAGGSFLSLAKLPPEVLFQGTKTVFIGGAVGQRAGASGYAELYLSPIAPDLVLRVEIYNSFDSNVGWVVPLSGSFLRDQR